MLVSLAQELGPGRSVVRLKAGDPFVYGRARGEAEALSAADVPFRVLPGLSSALTAPLLAGVPVTDPRLSRAFAVLSGHDLQGATPHDLSGFSRCRHAYFSDGRIETWGDCSGAGRRGACAEHAGASCALGRSPREAAGVERHS